MVLVEDSEGEHPMRVLTSEELAALRLELADRIRDEAVQPATRFLDVRSAAELVGVSRHKISTWLRRTVRPLPHVKDGR